ncbi:hypothetical protein ACIBKX_32670 [Streptomyces sp. NPDC050658]|uniref:hypothetical protein n=1 Tax=unclassified Streptomyces TaxID=2593676 RepID=UPI00343BFB87
MTTLTSTSGLRYRVHTSSSSTRRGEATLSLQVTNPTTAAIACTGITFAFPLTATPGANALTTSPASLEVTASKGWSVSDAGPGVYRADPVRRSVAPGERFTLTLSGIRPPESGGASVLHLTDQAHTTGQRPLQLPVRFWPTGDDGVFKNFYADNTSLERDHNDTLHWTCSKNPLIEYSLTYNTGGENPQSIHLSNAELAQYVTPETANNTVRDFVYPTEPLDGLVVGYQLEAVYKSLGDQEVKDLTTASFVHRGDLEAGNINSLTGVAQILTPTQQGFSNDTQYIAPTDGILTGSISGSTGQLWVQIAPPSGGLGGHLSMPSTFHLVLPQSTHDNQGAYNQNFSIPVNKNSTVQFGIPAQDYTLTWHPLGVGNLTDDTDDFARLAPHVPAMGPQIEAAWPQDQIVEDFYPDALTVPQGQTTHLRWHGPINGGSSLFSYTLTYNLYSGTDTQSVTVDDTTLQQYATPDPLNKQLAYFSVPTQPLNGLGVGFHLTATYQPDSSTDPLYTDLTTATVVTSGDLEVGHVSVQGSAQMLVTQPTDLDVSTTYTAPTDGFLFASVYHGALNAKVTPPDGDQISFAIKSTVSTDKNTADNQNFTLPIRKGTTISYSLPGGATQHQCTWHSLGTMNLTT